MAISCVNPVPTILASPSPRPAAIHSAQLHVTASVNPWLTAYVELLYDPQQSFGAGTITALSRNQIQLRRGYALIGDLNRSPVYGMIGGFDTPLGQTDTVNPFSLWTDGHTFAGLAYGALIGYSKRPEPVGGGR